MLNFVSIERISFRLSPGTKSHIILIVNLKSAKFYYTWDSLEANEARAEAKSLLFLWTSDEIWEGVKPGLNPEGGFLIAVGGLRQTAITRVNPEAEFFHQ
jgi:hypothetical protein